MIETNPQYVEPGYFYGSQYFLDRVELTSGKKPSIETRLGDGYFECGLIRKQLQTMAGRTILRDGCDEAEQYRRLYENALAEAEALELRPGVRLSKEQVASLRRDMIRLEAEKVRDYYQRQEESSGWLVSESSDEGHDRTTVQPVRLAAHELELSSPARIELKNGERQPWMEALKARKDIDWARVDENARAWANYDWSLSGPARALLSIALTVATAGTGATLAESH